MDELAAALRTYQQAFFERTGWKPFDVPEREEEDEEGEDDEED